MASLLASGMLETITVLELVIGEVTDDIVH